MVRISARPWFAALTLVVAAACDSGPSPEGQALMQELESRIEEVQAAIESGAKVDIVIPVTEPDPDLALQLEDEIEKAKAQLELAIAKAESRRGLVGALAQSTVATEEQTLAMLQ